MENKELIIGWEENLDYILWECCNWEIPRKIVAHINRDSKITIHKRDCEIIKNMEDKMNETFGLGCWLIL